jgi:hypothetical protein
MHKRFQNNLLILIEQITLQMKKQKIKNVHLMTHHLKTLHPRKNLLKSQLFPQTKVKNLKQMAISNQFLIILKK